MYYKNEKVEYKMGATQTMSLQEFMGTKGLSAELTAKEKDTVFSIIVLLILLISMIAGNLITTLTAVPAYLFL